MVSGTSTQSRTSLSSTICSPILPDQRQYMKSWERLKSLAMMSSRRLTNIVLISPNIGLISNWIERKGHSSWDPVQTLQHLKCCTCDFGRENV